MLVSVRTNHQRQTIRAQYTIVIAYVSRVMAGKCKAW